MYVCCMYVCMYVCMYLCMYVCMYVCMCVCVCECESMRLCVCVCVCIFTDVCIYVCVLPARMLNRTYMYKQSFKRMLKNMYITIIVCTHISYLFACTQ